MHSPQFTLASFRSSCRKLLVPLLATILLLGVTTDPDPASATNRSDLKWQTLETEHFLVHFHQGTEGTARRAAAIAEEIYPAITGLYDFEPKAPTHLIIRDTDDYANGAAYYYDDKIEIWATALEFELRGTHTWLRDVVTHEFTHIVQLQSSARLPHRMPAIYLQGFGYESERRPDVLIGYPNQIYSYPIPGTVTASWFAEGVCQYQTREVYNDWWDTHRDMLLRTHVLDRTLLTFDEMGGFGGNGLQSEMTYNQGNSLVRYIADEYGEDALREIALGLRSIWLLDMDRAFKKATGKTGHELYDEWKAKLEREYGEVQAKIAPTAIEGHTVSEGGYLNLYPAWKPGTDTLYWASNEGQDFGALTLVKLENAAPGVGEGAIEGICAISTPLSMTADGTTAYLSRRTDENPHGSRVNDIYLVDLESEKDERLTHALRAKDPAISPDGNLIAAITNGDGTNQLVILDAEDGKVLRQLTQNPHGTQCSTPSWSPDGRSILLCTFRGLSRDVLLIDAETGEEELIVDSPADERDPCFVPGEEAILFTSDRTGIFNIYRLNLETEEITQVTNLIGGAFYPAVGEDGTLAFSAFTGRGYEIRLLPRDEWGREPVSPPPPDPRGDYRLAMTGPAALAFDNQDRGFEGTASPYKLSYPVTQLMPRLILENGRPRLGLYVNSNEILDKQSIFAGAWAGRRHGGFEFEAFGGYENRFFPFTIFVEGYRVRRRSIDVQDAKIGAGADRHVGQIRPVNFEIRYDLVEGDVGIRYQWGEPYSITYWKDLSLYYTYQDYNINLFATDDLDNTFYGKGGWSYYRGHIANARFDYRKISRAIDSDINPRGGRTVMVRAAYTDAGLNPAGEVEVDSFRPLYEDNNFAEIEIDWREHLALPWKRHTLELRARGGVIDNTEVDDFFHFAVGSRPGLRGYTYYSLQGRKLGIGSVTYRFPIASQLNRQLLQFLVHRFYGGVFYEAGNVWNDSGLEGLSLRRLRQDAGFELRLETTSFYAFPADFYLEGAYGFSAPQGPGWHFYSGLLFGF